MKTERITGKARIRLIGSLAKNDFKSKYASSQLGVFWAFLRPIVMAGVYIFVFSVIARSAPVAEGYPYAFWLLPGLIAWFVFSDGVTSGTTTLTEYSYLVKNVRFDITILPAVKVASAFIIHTFFIGLVFFLYLVWGLPLKWQMLQLPYYYLALFCITLALARIACSLQPFFKDLTQALEILLMVLMWASPVMWDVSMAPARFQLLFKLNPLYHIINGYRDSMMGTGWFWKEPWQMVYFWVITLGLDWLGRHEFKRLSVHFADML